jgi:hypothetical protein
MKKTTLLFSLLTASSVFAASIPPAVQNVLKTYQAESYGLNNETLSMTVKKTQINDDMAALFFRGVCDSQFSGPSWEPMLIKRIEISNSDKSQIIGFNGGGTECKKMGSMSWDESEKYIKSLMKK